MRGSVVLSVIGHSALLGWVLFTIQTQTLPPVPQAELPLDVSIISPGEFTKVTKGDRNAKQLDAQPKEAPQVDPAKKEAEKPKPVATAPPPPPPPPPPEEAKPEPPPPPEKTAAAEPPPPPPVPGPTPEEKKKLDDLMKAQEEARRAEAEEKKKREEQQKKAEAKKKEDERKKQAELKKKKEEEKKRKEAEAKKKQDDEFKKISALLNKIPDKGAPAPASEPLEPSKRRGPVAGTPDGRDKQLSASELAILVQIIKSCVQSKWSVMGGGEGAQSAQVKIRLRFNPDGRLAAAPTIVNPQNTPFFLAVSDSALRAVQACEPFPLPTDKYDVWKDMILNFDPREMF